MLTIVNNQDNSDQPTEEKFLWNQIEELTNLRKNSIEIMNSTYKAYVNFLSILVAGIGAFLALGRNASGELLFLDQTLFWLVAILTGIAIFVYGIYIFNLEILTHINQTEYTKKINMTRRYLTRNLTHITSKMVLLPQKGSYPSFGQFTTLDRNISKEGLVAFLKWANCIIISITSSIPFLWSCHCLSQYHHHPWIIFKILSWLTVLFFFPFFAFWFSFKKHDDCFNKLIYEAKNKWNCRIKSYDYIEVDMELMSKKD